MSAEEASNLVTEMPEVRSTRRATSLCSRQSRTSKRSLTKSYLSVQRERLLLRKAVLQARQSFRSEQNKLLQEKIEFERRQLALEQQQFALQQQQKQIVLQQKQEELKQKLIAVKSANPIADRLEIAEIDAQQEVSGEMGKQDRPTVDESEISLKEPKEEKKSQGIKRFSDSQEKIQTPPLRPDVASLSNPRAPTRWDRTTASMERCLTMESTVHGLTKLCQVAMDQSVASNQMAASSQLSRLAVLIFSSDPLSYKYLLWRNALDCLVDAKPISDAKKMHYLSGNISGRTKKIVEHLIGGNEVRRRLEERYQPNRRKTREFPIKEPTMIMV